MVTNPPPIRVPAKLAQDKDLFAYFNELHTFLRLLWERTGGGTDAIADAADSNDAAVVFYSHAARIGSLGLDVDNAARAAGLALLSPSTAQIAALGLQADDAERVGMLSLSALPDKALIQHLIDEINQLRVEVAALYSERAKLAHLNNRVDELEILAWL